MSLCEGSGPFRGLRLPIRGRVGVTEEGTCDNSRGGVDFWLLVVEMLVGTGDCVSIGA